MRNRHMQKADSLLQSTSGDSEILSKAQKFDFISFPHKCRNELVLCKPLKNGRPQTEITHQKPKTIYRIPIEKGLDKILIRHSQ